MGNVPFLYRSWELIGIISILTLCKISLEKPSRPEAHFRRRILVIYSVFVKTWWDLYRSISILVLFLIVLYFKFQIPCIIILIILLISSRSCFVATLVFSIQCINNGIDSCISWFFHVYSFYHSWVPYWTG